MYVGVPEFNIAEIFAECLVKKDEDGKIHVRVPENSDAELLFEMMAKKGIFSEITALSRFSEAEHPDLSSDTIEYVLDDKSLQEFGGPLEQEFSRFVTDAVRTHNLARAGFAIAVDLFFTGFSNPEDKWRKVGTGQSVEPTRAVGFTPEPPPSNPEPV